MNKFIMKGIHRGPWFDNIQNIWIIIYNIIYHRSITVILTNYTTQNEDNIKCMTLSYYDLTNSYIKLYYVLHTIILYKLFRLVLYSQRTAYCFCSIQIGSFIYWNTTHLSLSRIILARNKQTRKTLYITAVWSDFPTMLA